MWNYYVFDLQNWHLTKNLKCITISCTLDYQKGVLRLLNKSRLNYNITILIHFYISLGIAVIFKLADRMRSMWTNGASKNRDSCRYFYFHFFPASKLFSIGSFCMFLFLSVSFCFFLYVYLRWFFWVNFFEIFWGDFWPKIF